jgi:hypothetical protein
MLTNVFDLVAARWLRRDTAGVEAPYRAPTAFVRLAVVFAGLNMVLLFVGGPTWGWGPMALGWGIVLLAVPFYLYRRHADAREGTPKAEPPSHLETLQTQEQTA